MSVAETIDLAKVQALRDAAARQHADYLDLATRARDAHTEAGRARAELFADPMIESPLAHATADELELTALDELEKAGITIQVVRRLVLAERRARALAEQAERAAGAVRSNAELLARIDAYLREQGIAA